MSERYPTNVSAQIREDDGVILISTDAYVSHKKQAGPYRSTFSMTLDEAANLRNQLSALINETEWQPMETAPLDGTEILLHTHNYETGVVTVSWSEGAWRDMEYDDYSPILWMPVPKPPETKT